MQWWYDIAYFRTFFHLFLARLVLHWMYYCGRERRRKKCASQWLFAIHIPQMTHISSIHFLCFSLFISLAWLNIIRLNSEHADVSTKYAYTHITSSTYVSESVIHSSFPSFSPRNDKLFFHSSSIGLSQKSSFLFIIM